MDATVRKRVFPDDFLWGTATSAYQVEGSPLADGAGASIWQRFCQTPGRVSNGDSGDVACDHYRRYREDVALMRELGLNAYRFSIAWGRVLPAGRGAVNESGLGFYDRLVDTLLEAGIEPLVTLYHWDLPAALDEQGGWLNSDVAHWFAEYAATVYRRLDGRVKKWITINEPWVVSDGGYVRGVLAPGRNTRHEAPIVTHNLLRAHGAAVQAYRAHGRHHIGLVVNLEPKQPGSMSNADRSATRFADAYMNRQYLDPVLLGRYPEELRAMFGEHWPDWPQADLELIRQPLDFIGVNYYTRSVVAANEAKWPVPAESMKQPDAIYTETKWEVFPKGLTDTLLWIRQRYGDVPLYITENGAAFADPATVAGNELEDPLRVDYLRTHIAAVRDAMAQGVDVRGYCVWSLLDNFEWALGYSKRFGIVHVDYATQRRTLKSSAHFYRNVIASHGAALQ